MNAFPDIPAFERARLARDPRFDGLFYTAVLTTGTRVLLELLLADLGVDPAVINRSGTAEFTHAAVAAYVASGMADVGFGVETAARRFDLDFIPVIRERYFLACHAGALDTPLLTSAQAAMAGGAFREVLSALPGYDGAMSGERLDLHFLFQE